MRCDAGLGSWFQLLWAGRKGDYNRFPDICAGDDLEGLAKVKAEGRARVRAWKARGLDRCARGDLFWR